MPEEKRIHQNLEQFSFPRIYGSEEEQRIFQLAKDQIEALGAQPIVQEFGFTNFYSILYNRILAVLVFWLLFILYINIGFWFNLINFIILASTFLLLFLYSRTPEKIRVGKRYSSQNLITQISIEPPTSQREKLPPPTHFVFLAHMDSKGQRFDITNRVRIYVMWTYSIITWTILIFFKNFLLPQYALFIYIFGIIPLVLNLLSVIFIFSNTNNNRSPGALDNASGVACVMELLHYYADPEHQPELKNVKLWFVLTGAEECGTMGVRHFYHVLAKESQKDRVIVLNFDSIGTNVDLIKFGLTSHTNFKFLNLFRTNARQLGLEMPTHRCPVGVHTDGYFFFKKGYRGVEFGDWDSYQYLHSAQDTRDKIDPKLLRKVCDIVIRSLSEINSRS
ncbi:MAG: M28 family peptidase [Promethearchaeota archaeon]|nr:MAG: M28 family peptidase [Candidatus Lokiarchaeota archaeon]